MAINSYRTRKETSCFPKKIISPELFWSESQKSWISSETKNTVAKIKEDKSETEIQKANEPEPETHPKSTTAEINGLSLVESSS